MKLIGLSLLTLGSGILVVAAVTGMLQRDETIACRDGTVIIGSSEAGLCRSHGGVDEPATAATHEDSSAVTVSKGIATVLLIAGGAFLLQAKHDRQRRVGRSLAAPAPAAWAPPAVEPTWPATFGPLGAPGAPTTLVGVEPFPIRDDDPDVTYHGDGLATAGGVLVELGSCGECGAPNVVRTNRSTGIRFLVCSTAPACSGTDVLRRATRRGV